MYPGKEWLEIKWLLYFLQVNSFQALNSIEPGDMMQPLHSYFGGQSDMPISEGNTYIWAQLKQLFIPLQAKRVEEFIEIRHKKFHPPVYWVPLGVCDSVTLWTTFTNFC